MYFHRETPGSANIISACTDHSVQIGDVTHNTSVVVGSDDLLSDWQVVNAATMKFEDIEPLTEKAPEIILLGTGRRLVFPAADIRARVMALGIGIEVMDTPAACRTYNILVGESRRVVAALIIEPEACS